MLQGSVLYTCHHLRAQTASILGCGSCREEVHHLFLCGILGKAPLVLPQGWVGTLLVCQASAMPRTLLQDLWHLRCREK